MITLSFGCHAQQKTCTSYIKKAVHVKAFAAMFAPKAASVLERLAQVAHIFRGVYLCE